MSIEAISITKLYGKQKALDNVSFSIKKGELAGFLGPNGAGKTTMMKIISGALPPDSGMVLINDLQISVQNLDIRKKIGYLPENNPLYTDLYVKEFLQIVAGFYRLKNKKQRISSIVEMTGLGDEQHKKIGALSKGYRQRVGLAHALIHDPEILILDEPTTGLDPNQLEEIRTLIRHTSNEKTVILSSHIMQEVEAVCNRILIINNGKIVADGGIDGIKSGNFSEKQIVVAKFSEKITSDRLFDIKGISAVRETENGFEIESDSEKDLRPIIFQYAVSNNLTLLTLQEKQQNLENIFQKLTKKNES